MAKVLIVENDSYILGFAFAVLQTEHGVATANSGAEVLELLNRQADTDMVILDASLADMDGFTLCQQIRQRYSHLRILMLTEKSQEEDPITGLMTGADDYLAKPFSPAQLKEKVKAVLHAQKEDTISAAQLMSFGPFLLDLKNYTWEKRGVNIRLTRVEYDMVKYFMENPGMALSTEEIAARVWGADAQENVTGVDRAVRILRLKLEDDPDKPGYITTILGFGYQWNA